MSNLEKQIIQFLSNIIEILFHLPFSVVPQPDILKIGMFKREGDKHIALMNSETIKKYLCF